MEYKTRESTGGKFFLHVVTQHFHTRENAAPASASSQTSRVTECPPVFRRLRPRAQNPRFPHGAPRVMEFLVRMALTAESRARSETALQLATELVAVFSPTSSYVRAWRFPTLLVDPALSDNPKKLWLDHRRRRPKTTRPRLSWPLSGNQHTSKSILCLLHGEN
jgi:hypothetical protein